MSRTYAGSTSPFTLSGNASNLRYGVSGLRDDWTALVAAPTGQTLHVGSYSTTRFAGPGQARLDVFGDGRGCDASTGSLTITELRLDGDRVAALAATFVQHCESATPALRGTILFHAGTFPLPATTAAAPRRPPPSSGVDHGPVIRADRPGSPAGARRPWNRAI
ncbi:MAG: hypothetical protein V7637_32 [Mycobacteriales bacterium]